MRKSRKLYKSKSKKRQIKKNKFNKNKTRKIRGGTHENNDYIFVGVYTNPIPWDRDNRFFGINDIAGIPIFLPNNNTLKNHLPGRIVFGVVGDMMSGLIHLLLPVLYKLNYRGLNFEVLSRANGRTIFFYDNNETPILDYNTFNNIVYSKKKWTNEYKDEIKNMELKYPGLFQRMYVTEEEERQALESLERKENEQKQLEQEMKMSLKPSNLDELSDEEKQKIYQEEMEYINNMIPYLREDLKKRKTIKMSKKKYYNNLFTDET